jgi:hypothetical protein
MSTKQDKKYGPRLDILYCVDPHPILKRQQAIVFIPPILCAPIDALRSCTDCFELPEHATQLSANCRSECRARKQVPLLFGPEGRKQLIWKKFDVPAY